MGSGPALFHQNMHSIRIAAERERLRIGWNWVRCTSSTAVGGGGGELRAVHTQADAKTGGRGGRVVRESCLIETSKSHPLVCAPSLEHTGWYTHTQGVDGGERFWTLSVIYSIVYRVKRGSRGQLPRLNWNCHVRKAFGVGQKKNNLYEVAARGYIGGLSLFVCERELPEGQNARADRWAFSRWNARSLHGDNAMRGPRTKWGEELKKKKTRGFPEVDQGEEKAALPLPLIALALLCCWCILANDGQALYIHGDKLVIRKPLLPRLLRTFSAQLSQCSILCVYTDSLSLSLGFAP